ncbi:similar to Saccharomyces cerevisiae YLR454W FMP27 Putative protein of unknown function [Maudiozyma barnettii]|uniref:FMP27 GFWDK domain-containing protein n=1 Tax=Maudiozyma barnettii TaxID=61262 RepID=A0A8H2VH62_9SACH|nr:Fmp27p [Kazachstania barnettii]CAB4255596.1 similar to Saccharomyces cerevisiae YLR454W FMP27 Putative protein of unknown function [Kazachstania barnettii]CAD1784156.1 similar to Saccharomyces cerevisiae YLR454W FMP27 Putative protein of unknown function [Kazachstania barnettii]
MTLLSILCTILSISVSFRLILYFAFGLYIGFFNPVRGEFIRVSYKDKFKIKGLQIYPYRKKIVVNNLKIFQTGKRENYHDIKSQKINDENKKKKIPTWLETRFQLLSKCLNNFNVIFVRIEIPDQEIVVNELVLESELCSKTKEIGIKTFIRDISWHKISMNKESLYNVSAVLNFDKLYNRQFPLDNIDVDLKVGKLILPMETLYKYNIVSTSSKLISSKKDTTDESLENVYEIITKVMQKMNTISEISEIISHINVTVDEFYVKNYAITSHYKLVEMNKYLNYNLFVSNFTLDLTRFTKEMPGYKLYFREDDTPFKYTTALSRLNICVNMMKKNKAPEIIKIFELPSLALYGESNLLSQKFKFNQGETLENATFNVKGNISSPTIDIDINNISFINSFMKNIKVFTQSFSDPVEVTCTGKSKFTRKREMFTTFFRSFLPLFNVKLTLEDTKVAITDEDDLILLRISALILNFKSTRNLVSTVEKTDKIYFSTVKSLELLDLSVRHKIKNCNYNCQIFGMDAITLQEEVKMEPTDLLSVIGNLETFQVDLSELPSMVMLSKLIRHIDCQIVSVEEQYFKPLYEKFASMIENSENKCSIIGSNHENFKINPKDFMFVPLPDYFDYIKIDIRNFKMALGSRSVFMPPDVFSSTEPQSSHDLVDGKLRKLLIHMDKLQIALCGSQTQWKNRVEAGRVTMVQSGDSSEYKSYGRDSLDDVSTSSSTDVGYPWNLNVLINSIVTTVIGESPGESNELTKRTVSKLSIFSMKVYPETEGFAMSDEPQIVVNITNKKLNTLFCLNTVFVAISGVHTLHQIFSKREISNNRESWAKKYLLAIAKSKQKSKLQCIDWTHLKNMVKISLAIDEFHQLTYMPNGLRTKFEAVNLFTSFENMNQINQSGEYFRMCIQSPTEPSLWERFVVINRFKISTNIREVKEQMKSNFQQVKDSVPGLILENESWHFTVPHNFAIYKLIDNFSTIFKSIKQMMYSFKTSKNDIVIFPHAVKIPSLPLVNIRSKRYILSIADDPFEAKMNLVFQIGLEEQKSRIAKWNQFNTDMKDIVLKSGSLDSNETVSELINKRKIITQLELAKSGVSDIQFGNENSFNWNILKSIPDTVERAYDRLQKNISTSWIRRIQVHKCKEREEFSKNFSFLWGNIDFSKLPSSLGKNVKDFTKYPFLSNLIMENVDVTLFRPDIGIENVPKFVHTVGKNVPEDTKYSIMIPMHIDARFSEIRWHLRDYPLPFIYVPPIYASQSKESRALRIHGDIVVAEDMILSDKELRAIFVPLVPSIAVENTDRYYSMIVPRTVTSIKFYSDLQLDVNSKDTTTVAFGGSYQPAIQHMMQCIDNISKPPMDPSRKIGFWDKVRYLFHGKVKISWVNDGNFEIYLKASKSPYKLGGDYAGYALGFDSGVTLTCNEDNDPKKFLSCSSDKLYFFMPNLFAKPFLTWYKSSDETFFFPNQENSNLQHSASFYYFLNLEKGKNDRTDIHNMQDSFKEKVAIKLTGGVKFNLGMAFERYMTEGSNHRSGDFTEHYKIRLCNPIYIEDLHSHDSYAGFRSDFVHMSFDLRSKNNEAYNAMQLTPNSMHSFFKWWKTFSGNFPVRRGPLFGIQSISPKFSEHLYTISYLADISPFFISHMCHNIDYDKDIKKSFLKVVQYAGIKGKTDNFLLDLHQRKEVLTEYNEKLDIRKKVKKMKFHIGDIRLHGIDIRTVNATLNRLEYVEQKDDGVYNIFDNDMTWFDQSDYREAYFVNPFKYIPTVDVTALLYAPVFVYEKRAAYGDKYQIDPDTLQPIEPISDTVSHDCIVNKPQQPSLETLESRSKSVSEFVQNIKKNIEKCSDPEKLKGLQHMLEEARYAQKQVKLLTDDLKTLYGKFNEKKLYNDYKTKGIQELDNSIAVSDLLKYENKYFVFNMLLKINRKVRDDLYKFKHFYEIANSFLSLSSRKTLNKFEKLISHKISSEWKPGLSSQTSLPESVKPEHTFDTSGDEGIAVESILAMFNDCLSNISTTMSHEIHKNHFVQFVIPQIQVTCERQAQSAIIITSPNIMMKFLSFEEKENDNMYAEDIFLKRSGILLSKANVFLFNKKDYANKYGLYFDTNSYGQEKNSEWSPWLGIEHSFESSSLDQESLVKNFYAMYKSQNVLPFSNVYDMIKSSFEDRTTVLLPKINISLTSKTFTMLTGIIKRLVLFDAVEESALKRKIEKVALGYDIDNIPGLYNLLSSLCRNQQKLKMIDKELRFRREILDDAGQADLSNIYSERMNHLLKLYMLMKVLESNNTWKVSDNTRRKTFDVKVNEIIVHLLNDNKTPFLDVAIAKFSYNKSTLPSGFNNNRVRVDMFQIFNLEDVRYHNMVGPYIPPTETCKVLGTTVKNCNSKNIQEYNDRTSLIDIVWEMDKPVGGIKIVNNVETHLQGICVKIEDKTIDKIIIWLSDSSSMTNVGKDDDITNGDHKFNAGEADDGNYDNDESISDLINPDETADALREQFALLTKKNVDLNEMIKRSSDYIIVDDLLLNSFKLCVSYKGKGKRRLIDVSDFLFTFPKLVVKNQILQLIDFLRVIKRVLVRVLLNHSIKFLSTKLKKRRSTDLKLEPGKKLKPLTEYKEYVAVHDLQKQ